MLEVTTYNEMTKMKLSDVKGADHTHTHTHTHIDTVSEQLPPRPRASSDLVAV